MMEFREDLLTDSSLAVVCTTQEQWATLLSWAHENNVGRMLELDDWSVYKDDTYMRLYGGCYGRISNIKDNFNLLTYEEALVNKSEEEKEEKIILTERVPDILIQHAGDYDLYEVLSFIQELLQQNYRVEMESLSNVYELKGYKGEE